MPMRIILITLFSTWFVCALLIASYYKFRDSEPAEKAEKIEVKAPPIASFKTPVKEITPVESINTPFKQTPSVDSIKTPVNVVKDESTARTEVSSGNVQRAEAVKALRAVRSALSAGANFQEFKKYHIDAKVKIDNLPDTPENKIIRDILDIYNDAVAFSIAKITGDISQSKIDISRAKYKNNQPFMKVLSITKSNNSSRGLEYELARVNADTLSQLLLAEADRKFGELK